MELHDRVIQIPTRQGFAGSVAALRAHPANSPDRCRQSPDHESGLCVVQPSSVLLTDRASVNEQKL